MSDKPENGLKQELDRRKRINRIKSIIVSLVGIWMLASVILCATLFVKVIHLENNLNKVLQNMPQVEQVENEETKNSPDADTGKNVEYGKQDQTGQDDANKKKADDGEKLKVYLTFDDGPSCLTEKYLDILESEGVKATFFVIGQQINGEEQTIKREISQGHEIGVHTYCHEADRIYCNCDTYYKDVIKVKNILKKQFGYDAGLVRFPWGSANTYISSYRDNIIQRFKNIGLEYADWNVSAEDSVGNPTQTSIMQNIRKDYVRYDEPVILMHDSGANKMTLSVLNNIILELKEKGYGFDVLSKRSKCCHFYEN